MDEIFIGREKELNQAKKLIECNFSTCSYLLIEGVAGMGKTTFACKFLQTARDREFLILRGGFYEGVKHSYLGPWRQILEKGRHYLNSLNCKSSQSLLLQYSPLFKALRDIWSDVDELKSSVEEERKYLFFSWIADFLEELSKQKKIVIFIEDIHLSDDSNLHLLEYLSDILEFSPIVFLFTSRPKPYMPFTEHIKLLNQSLYIPLIALSELEIQSYLIRYSRDDLSISEVMNWTDGIPLRVMLFIQNNLSPDKGSKNETAVYSAYWESLKKRITIESRKSLIRLAFIGNSFTEEEARELFYSVSEKRGESNLEECKIYKIIINFGDHISFFHDQFRLFLIGTLNEKGKNKIIVECASVFESKYKQESERKIFLLAELYHLSEKEEMSKKAVFYMIQGAELFEASGSYHEAADYLERILNSYQNLFDDDSLRDLKLKLLKTYMLSFQLHKMVSITNELCSFYRENQNIKKMVEILKLPLGYILGLEFRDLYEFLLSKLEFSDPETVLIQNQYGLLLMNWQYDMNLAKSELKKGLKLAVNFHNEDQEYVALVQLAYIEFRLGEIESGSLYLKRSFSLSVCYTRLQHHIMFAFEMTIRGEMAKALDSLNKARVKLILRKDPVMTLMYNFFYQRQALYQGNWETVLSVTHEDPKMSVFHIPRILTWLFTGEVEKADEYIETILKYKDTDNPEYMLRGTEILAWVGSARSYLISPSKRISEIEESIRYILEYKSPPVQFIIDACIAAGWSSKWIFSTEECKEFYDKLCSYDSIWAEEEKYSIEFAKALLCLKTGAEKEAILHFHRALKWCEHFEEFPWRAWISYELSQILTSGDEKQNLLRQSKEIADRLGMKPLIKKLNHIRIVEKNNSILTDREIEVVSFLAKGYSDKEIADFLHISVHTVANHLRNIYKKLEVSTRGEAVHTMLSEGIIDL